jgi:hypothetical protein
MSSDPLLETITGNLAKNLNRKKDAEQNIQTVRAEFVGKPVVCHELVRQIIYLRRGIDTSKNTVKFFELWETYHETLLKELDTRWLLSVVDTAIDVGDDQESAVAMNISQCINQCNIHTSLLVNAVDGRLDGNKLQREMKMPTWDGMITVDVPTGDMIHNMMIRMDKVIATEPWLNDIWIELKNRLCAQENLPMNILCKFSRFEHQRKYFK